MGFENTRWKTWHAVEALAVSSAPLTERLFDAYLSHLLNLRDSDFPVELRSDVATIRSALTSVAASGDEGNLRATLNVMTEEQALEVARAIATLHFAVTEAWAEQGDVHFPRV